MPDLEELVVRGWEVLRLTSDSLVVELVPALGGTVTSLRRRADDLELLWQRVRHKTTRPLLRTANPRETLRELYERRQPLYAQADIVVESAAERSVEDMAARVVEALQRRPDVLEV